MAMPQVCDMQVSDLDIVLQMNTASIPAVSALTRDELRELMGRSARARVIECDGEVAGFLLGFVAGADYASLNYQWFCARYESFFYVDRIVIGKSWRGQGLGAALYADVDAFARTQGLSSVTCEVNLRPHNAESLAFHGAQGFEQVGIQDTEGGNKRVSLMARVVD